MSRNEYRDFAHANVTPDAPPQFHDELEIRLRRVESRAPRPILREVNYRVLTRLYGPINNWSKELLVEQFGPYDVVWLMGIYPGEHSKRFNERYAHQYNIPGINPHIDVGGSPYAISKYEPDIGWSKFDRAVSNLHSIGKKVIIDYIPNHTGIDFKWVPEHPEYYVQGTDQQFRTCPSEFQQIVANDGKTYFIAHGKDRFCPPAWADTLQLNYANPNLQDAMGKILLDLVDHADGVRCDMATLVNASEFRPAWDWCLSEAEKRNIDYNSFWHKWIPLAKAKARRQGKKFMFIGEMYRREEEVRGLFDLTYDHQTYDAIYRNASNGIDISKLKLHVTSILRGTNGLMSYSENHDEQRVAAKLGVRYATTMAALEIILPSPLYLVFQGQEDGRKIKPSVQTNRFPDENIEIGMRDIFLDLLDLKHTELFQYGQWNEANILTRHSGIIALECRSKDNSFCAVVCINATNNNAECSIPEIKSNINSTVISLTDPRNIQPDQIRAGGMYIGLQPGEVQVVFFSTTPNTEIQKATSARQNLAFAD